MNKSYATYATEEAVKLLAIDSPTGYTKKAAEWVKDAFMSLGYEARISTKGGVLVTLSKGSEESKNDGLMLAAHTDTVSVIMLHQHGLHCVAVRKDKQKLNGSVF